MPSKKAKIEELDPKPMVRSGGFFGGGYRARFIQKAKDFVYLFKMLCNRGQEKWGFLPR